MADSDSALAAALRDRYAIERELGRGGMAVVYLAQDLKHDRPVALKVLLPDIAASLGAERFQREIRLAARLQHPHILTVHDSGEAAGQLWFTMPYVRGESLRQRIQREKQLPVDEALRITHEAGLALDYAHGEGVIHRDIKPENLLLTKDGSTLVADFGIARALSSAEHLTQTGMSLGTPAYMSPEQASGESALDARTDLYALASVLYEMLAGEPPYTGPTAHAIITKRFTEPVPSVRKQRPSVPEHVEAAIQRALAPVPADRFASAGEFARALEARPPIAVAPAPSVAVAAPSVAAAPDATAARRPSTPARVRKRRVPEAAVLLGLGFLIGLGVLFAWRRSRVATSEVAGTKVLAVLPFENLGDSAEAYFADGVANEVRSKLTKVTGLEVIASGSSNEYRHTSKPPQQIARELGADYLLTATVQWEKVPGGGKRVRVSPELVDAGAGHSPSTRWGEQFDASLTDVFQVQADIATKVASALDVALGDSARRELAAKPTLSLGAYDAYLKGDEASQDLAVSDPPSLRRAIDFYQQAVHLDSAFAPAWARLSGAQTLLYANETPAPELKAQAKQSAERAIALAPDKADGHRALCEYYRVGAETGPALAACDAGLKLAPNNVDLLTASAVVQEAAGRWDTALALLSKAATLDPRSVNTARRKAFALLALRRYPEAEEAIRRARGLAPTNQAVIENEAMLHLAQGDLPGAQAVVRNALASVDTTSVLVAFANFWDLYWVLDDAQQRRLLELPTSAFYDNAGTMSFVRAETYWLRGDTSHARVYAESTVVAMQRELQRSPNDDQRHVLRGIALAYLARKAEAVQEGERGTALLPMSRDAYRGAYDQLQLVRIYILVGQHEKALDALEPLLRSPFYISSGWLRIDPNFVPLRGNPRFQKLVQ